MVEGSMKGSWNAKNRNLDSPTSILVLFAEVQRSFEQEYGPAEDSMVKI
jgi:hypothetical protein